MFIWMFRLAVTDIVTVQIADLSSWIILYKNMSCLRTVIVHRTFRNYVTVYMEEYLLTLAHSARHRQSLPLLLWITTAVLYYCGIVFGWCSPSWEGRKSDPGNARHAFLSHAYTMAMSITRVHISRGNNVLWRLTFVTAQHATSRTSPFGSIDF